MIEHDFESLGLDKETFKLGADIETLFKAWSEASEGDEKVTAQTSLTEAVQKEVKSLESRYNNAEAYDDHEVMRYTLRIIPQWKTWTKHYKLDVKFEDLDPW